MISLTVHSANCQMMEAFCVTRFVVGPPINFRYFALVSVNFRLRGGGFDRGWFPKCYLVVFVFSS